MKKRIASMVLATTVALGSVSIYAESYPSDIGYSKYEEAIKYSYDNEIMTGYPDGKFRPTESITRAEFATMVARWRELKLDEDAKFSDVKGHWASKEIGAIAKAGWMKGVGENRFNPEDKITYIEALTVMVRAVGKENEADEFGGYPMGYEYTADRYGFMEGISGELESPIYRGAVSQIVLNSKDRIEAGDDDGSDEELVDKLGTVKSQELLETAYAKVQKDVELASAIELLPKEAYIKLTSGEAVLLKINWNSTSTGYNKNLAGTYSIEGEVELPSGISDPGRKVQKVYGTIEVVEDGEDTSGEKIVNTYYDITTKDYDVDFGTTLEDAKKTLPSKISLYLIGGGSVKADIEWTIPGYSDSVSKKYDAIGRIVLPTGVVDRLGIVENLSATVTVDSEPEVLAIQKVEMLNSLEYKITTNRFLRSILPGTVSIKDGSDVEKSIADVSYGSNERELIVKLDSPLDSSESYKFTVVDSDLSGAGAISEYSYNPVAMPGLEVIDRIIVSDNTVPAGDNVKMNFKALNASGIDITESVRGQVDIISTMGNKTGAEEFAMSDGQVEFFYIEYKDKDGETQSTDTKRIIGANRKIVSIGDWIISDTDSNPNWDEGTKSMQVSGGMKYLYIKPRDQFGDLGETELMSGEQIELKSQNEQILTVESGSIGEGEKYSEYSLAKIVPKKVGTTKLELDIKRAAGDFKATLDIAVIEDSKLSGLSLESSSITMSSSSDLSVEDRSESVKVEVVDQYGNKITPTSGISSEILSGGDLISVSSDPGKFDEFTVTAKEGQEGSAKVKFTYEGKSTELTVNLKKPGTVYDIYVYGFEDELVKGGDPSMMELRAYQVDENGLKVKLIQSGLVAMVVDRAGNVGDVAFNGVNGVVTIDSSGLTANTVNTLTLKVGGMTVLEDRLVVRE